MLIQKVKITNPMGLEVQAAGKLCKLAMKYKSLIMMYKDGDMANAKSMLSVLGACIKAGDEIEIQCEGEDEEEALEKIVAFLEGGFEV